MAPALAASGHSLAVSAAITGWSGSGTGQKFTLAVTVTNTGAAAATVSTVRLLFPSGWNPNCANVSGWTRTGNNSATVTFTRTSPLSLAAHAATSFTVTVDPDNSVVAAGTYIEDGGGLTVLATSTTPGATVTPTVIDVPGLYANLVMTGSAAWSRTGGQYYLTATATVRNRGRTATSDLQVSGVVTGVGTSTGNATNVASGWTFRTSPETFYERTGSELAPGQSVPFTSTRMMTGAEAGTSGTLTLTPRDQGTGNEIVRALSIAVPASSSSRGAAISSGPAAGHPGSDARAREAPARSDSLVPPLTRDVPPDPRVGPARPGPGRPGRLRGGYLGSGHQGADVDGPGTPW